MKKLTLILTILLVPLFLTACTKKEVSLKKNQDATVDTKSADAPEVISGSLLDLVKANKNLKCTGSFSTGDGEMATTVYVSGNKTYSESEIKTEEMSLKTYMIFDGDWMYSWSDGDNAMATKMKVSELEDMAKDLTGDMTEEEVEERQAAYQQDWDYKCTVWVPNQAKFNPPTDVNFMDATEMLNNFMNSDSFNEMKSAGCAACDSMPDAEAQEECRVQMGC